MNVEIIYMAWCYYCRTYTVNGRCPKCNRMYQEPNKQYDFYGKEIKHDSSSSTTITLPTSRDFRRGFWLGMGICFFSIIIAKKHNRKLLKGAITGTIISGLFYIHVLTIIIYIILGQYGLTNSMF